MKIDRGQTKLRKQARNMTRKTGALIVLLLVGMVLISVRAEETSECLAEGARCNRTLDCCGTNNCQYNIHRMAVCTVDKTVSQPCLSRGAVCKSYYDCCGKNTNCLTERDGINRCSVEEVWLKQCAPLLTPCDDGPMCCGSNAFCEYSNTEVNSSTACRINERLNPYCIIGKKQCDSYKNCCEKESCYKGKDGASVCLTSAAFRALQCSYDKECEAHADCCNYLKCFEGKCSYIWKPWTIQPETGSTAIASQCHAEGEKCESKGSCCVLSNMCRHKHDGGKVCMTKITWRNQCRQKFEHCYDDMDCCKGHGFCTNFKFDDSPKICYDNERDNPNCIPGVKPCNTFSDCCPEEWCYKTRENTRVCDIHSRNVDANGNTCSILKECKTHDDCCKYSVCFMGKCRGL